MGLGKTAQSISVMAWLQQHAGCPGPFLVVAPLTTLGHWQREIETWTDMVSAWCGLATKFCLCQEEIGQQFMIVFLNIISPVAIGSVS